MKEFIKKTLAILNAKERKQLMRITIWNVMMSIADIAALALLLLVIHLYTQPEPSGNAFMPYGLLNTFFLAPILIFLVLFLLKNIAGFFVARSQYNFVFGVASRLADKAMKRYLDIAYTDYVQVDASVRIRQISHQPVEFSAHILLGLMQISTEVVMTILAILAIVLFNAQLFLLLLIILLPPVIITAYFSKRRLKSVRVNVKNTSEKATQYLQEALEGYVEGNVYHKKDFFAGRFMKHQKALNGYLTELQVTQAIPARFIEVFVVLGLFLLIVVNKYGSYSAASELINIGAFMAAAYKIIPGITRIANISAQMRMYAYSIDGVSEMGNTTEVPQGSKESIRSLVFKDVSYAYGSHKVMQDFNMEINTGDFVGIASASGKGKTTLINLLLGFLKEENGSVLINGLAKDDGLRRQYWHNIAYVKQQHFLIHDSIKNNITFNDEEWDDVLLQEVINVAGLRDFVNSFPEKADKIISDNGKNISGGQRQRIALARALYKKADFIILDEPFSELDETSELSLLQYFKALSEKGSMIILITHHKASLAFCNKIVTVNE